jgi:hypothetical protein
MVLGEGLSSRVTSSSVTSSRGSTSRELEQLIIESGSLAIQRVLHVSVHVVSWWLVSVPRPSQGRRLHRDTFIESTFIPWVKPAVRGVGGPDGVCSSRLHEAFMQRTLLDLWAILRLATLPHQTPATTCHTPKSFSTNQSKLGNERSGSRTWWQENFPSHIVSLTVLLLISVTFLASSSQSTLAMVAG